MDEAATMRRVAEVSGRVVDGIDAGQLDLPSPCEGWSVRDVLEHVVRGAEAFATCVRDGSVTDAALTEIRTTDRLGADHRASYRRALRDAVDAISVPGTAHRIARFPYGEMPIGLATNIAIFDVTTHAWDLAKATGQSTELDPEIVEIAFRVGQTLLSDDVRNSGMFGPAVEIPAGAPAPDRLAALAGRTP